MATFDFDLFMDDLDDFDTFSDEFMGQAGNDIPGLDDFQHVKCDDLSEISKLPESQWYKDIMKKIDDYALQKQREIPNEGMALDEENPEFKLIADCNRLLVEVDAEIAALYSFVSDVHRLKFPELRDHPIDYAQVLKVLRDVTGTTPVDLDEVPHSAVIMVVSLIAFSTRGGKLLPEGTIQQTLDACDLALSLETSKTKLLQFMERMMLNLAPNLSAIVGQSVASKLIGSAGGLSALVTLPVRNLKCIGSKRNNLEAGFSSETQRLHVGFLEETEIYQSTPPSLRDKVFRFLSEKCSLAAKVDASRSDPTGETGRALREQIQKKIELLQQRPPVRLPKPLPVPDRSGCKKKRGGRRLRKMKERYGTTDIMRPANRMLFGVGLGKLRLPLDRGVNKLAAKVTKRFKGKRRYI